MQIFRIFFSPLFFFACFLDVFDTATSSLRRQMECDLAKSLSRSRRQPIERCPTRQGTARRSRGIRRAGLRVASKLAAPPQGACNTFVVNSLSESTSPFRSNSLGHAHTGATAEVSVAPGSAWPRNSLHLRKEPATRSWSTVSAGAHRRSAQTVSAMLTPARLLNVREMPVAPGGSLSVDRHRGRESCRPLSYKGLVHATKGRDSRDERRGRARLRLDVNSWRP